VSFRRRLKSPLSFFLLFVTWALWGSAVTYGISGNSRERCFGYNCPKADRHLFDIFLTTWYQIRDARYDKIGAQKALGCVLTVLD
jgi:hypothetical protein